jgi:diadenosine tetraphosphatase ApaH/serine/threonine PP2A family protein phosphatase
MVLTGVLDNVTLINPGSVGFPVDGDPRASWTLLDLERGTVHPRRVEYDVEKAVRELRFLPDAERQTLAHIYRHGMMP